VSGESVSLIDRFTAPYARDITLEAIEHESGLRMLRVRIREGSRFTIMDIDAETAKRWTAGMSSWINNQSIPG
jgi:hypothetical protein